MEIGQHQENRVQYLERMLKEHEERIAILEARLRTDSGTAQEDRLQSMPTMDDATGSSNGMKSYDANTQPKSPHQSAESISGHCIRIAGHSDNPLTEDGQSVRNRSDGKQYAKNCQSRFGAHHSDSGKGNIENGNDDRQSNTRSNVMGDWNTDDSEYVSAVSRSVVKHLRSTIEGLDTVTRKMLAHYHEYGPASPLDAHVVAGGDGDRTTAYRRNGVLREGSLVSHAGRGLYTSRLLEIVNEAHDGRLDEENLQHAIDAVEESLPVASPPEMAADWPEA